MLIRSRVRPAAPSGGSALYVNGYDDTGFYNALTYPGGPTDKAGAALTNGSGITIQSNTTYSNYKNLAFGQIGTTSTPVHNVVFNNCMWENSGQNAPNVILCGDGLLTFNYCTIRPAGLSDGTNRPDGVDGYQFGMLADGTKASPGTWNSFLEGSLVVNRCDFWGFGNATKIAGGTSSRTHTFTNNWFHSARLNNNPDYDDHTDGPGSPGGGSSSYTTYTGNRIESEGDTNGLTYQSQPGGNSQWDHFTITNNLFGGFGNCVNITNGAPGTETAPTNITFTDNTFSTFYDCYYSPVYKTLFSGTGSTWRRNTWLVPPGAAWGTSGNSGKFWVPTDSNRNRTTGSDTPYVSATDYTG